MSSSLVCSVAWNTVHTVSVRAYPARFVPAGLMNVHGASIVFTPSSVATCIIPFDTIFICAKLWISPTSVVPAGMVISLAYTPLQKYSVGGISAGLSLETSRIAASRSISLSRLSTGVNLFHLLLIIRSFILGKSALCNQLHAVYLLQT